MLRRVAMVDDFFVVSVGGNNNNNNYAIRVNDCAWHETNAIEAASKFSAEDINTNLIDIRNSGYKEATPVAVNMVYQLCDVRKKGSTPTVYDGYDFHVAGHPIAIYPRLGIKIIKLKTAYSRATNDHVLQQVKKDMAACIEEYKNFVQFCHVCNVVEDGMVVTPDTFGSFITHKYSDNAQSLYECEQCGRQLSVRIDNWE